MNIIHQAIDKYRNIFAFSMLFVAAALSLPAIAQETGAASGEPQVVLEPPGQPEQAQVLEADQLEELVGPIALYPDDLVAIVLPAATYPLQVAQAARFLEDREQNPALEPDSDWDDSVVALLNYPQVLALMNDDLDWTWRLGNAVLNQQDDVVQAIGSFREQAYAAGNLKTDEHQNVIVDEDVIEIQPADPEVIYVPYYEPSRVVVVQAAPAYFYYPYAYPLYYYPYPATYAFSTGFFWGVSTAFTIGWHSHHLHVHYPYYPSHPYYRYPYYRNHYVRYYPPTRYPGYPRPYREQRNYGDRYSDGDRWHASSHPASRPVRYSGTSRGAPRSTAVNSYSDSGNRGRNRSSAQISASYRNTLARDSSIRQIRTAGNTAVNTGANAAGSRGAGWKERTVTSSNARTAAGTDRPASYDQRNWRPSGKQPTASSSGNGNLGANAVAGTQSRSQRSSQMGEQVRQGLARDTSRRQALASNSRQDAGSAANSRSVAVQGRQGSAASHGAGRSPGNARGAVNNEIRTQSRSSQPPVQRERSSSARSSAPRSSASGSSAPALREAAPAPAKSDAGTSAPSRQSSGGRRSSGNSESKSGGSKPRSRPH
jgi:hypothetical protein